jgi:hypothetical protein
MASPITAVRASRIPELNSIAGVDQKNHTTKEARFKIVTANMQAWASEVHMINVRECSASQRVVSSELFSL